MLPASRSRRATPLPTCSRRALLSTTMAIRLLLPSRGKPNGSLDEKRAQRFLVVDAPDRLREERRDREDADLRRQGRRLVRNTVGDHELLHLRRRDLLDGVPAQ